MPLIALLGAWIAARQMVIADEKLRLDAFDRQYERRFAVYEATRKILAQTFEGISEKDVQIYGLSILDAQFLFDDEMFRYLKEIHSRINVLCHASSDAAASTDVDEKAQYRNVARENLDWVIKQGDDVTGFATRFVPFLVYKPLRRPWLLRWP